MAAVTVVITMVTDLRNWEEILNIKVVVKDPVTPHLVKFERIPGQIAVKESHFSSVKSSQIVF